MSAKGQWMLEARLRHTSGHAHMTTPRDYAGDSKNRFTAPEQLAGVVEATSQITHLADTYPSPPLGRGTKIHHHDGRGDPLNRIGRLDHELYHLARRREYAGQGPWPAILHDSTRVRFD